MRIHHLALRSFDLARLERFYVEVLGFTATRRDGLRSVWLSADDAIVMLEEAESAEPPIPRDSMELVAFAIAPEEKDAWETRLHDAGIAIEARSAFTLYFRDPDGRRIALSHYPHAGD